MFSLPPDLTPRPGALGLRQELAPGGNHTATPLTLRMGKEACVHPVFAGSLSCLAIAALYYLWRDVYLPRRKQRLLRERVAYMLWIAAQKMR